MARRMKEDVTNSQAWQNWMSDEPAVPTQPTKVVKKLGLAADLARQPAEEVNTMPVAAKRPQKPIETPRSHSFSLDRFVDGDIPVTPIVSYEKRRKQKVASIDMRQAAPKLPEIVPAKAEVQKKEVQPLVSVQIAFPKVKLPKIDVAKYKPTRNQLRVAAVSMASIALIVGGWIAVRASSNKPTETVKKPVTNATVSDALGFVPVAPPGKGTISPKNQNVYYSSVKKFYQYQEQHEGASITVNEQPMPEKLKQKAEFDKLVKSLNTTDSFTTTSGTVHVATDERSGAQRLVLSNKYMLMFLQSNKTFSNEAWAQYIESFERIE